MRIIIVSVMVVFMSAFLGMLFGNIVMYSYDWFVFGQQPLVRHQPFDMILASFGSMIGAGSAMFIFGKLRQ